MEPIFARLKSLDIPQESYDYSEQKLDAPANDLKERIIRRAQELRLKWQEMEMSKGKTDPRDSQNGPKRNGPETTPGQQAPPDEPSQPPDDPRPSPSVQQQPLVPSPGIPGISQHEEVQAWVIGKGTAGWRRLHKWAKELGAFKESDMKDIYWVAQKIEKKKTPSHSEAHKVKQLWEKAARRGFK